MVIFCTVAVGKALRKNEVIKEETHKDKVNN
jgi:hypothetical protein